MKIQIYTFFICICLVGCSRDKNRVQETDANPNIHVIDIDRAEKVDRILLSEFCFQAKTIILETNDNVLIGKVSGVQAYKDLIFVLDDSNNAGLYAFNQEGAFVRKYGNRGPGPGEYLSLNDFTIDTENEIVYLMDDEATQILMYEIFTGKFVNTVRLDDRPINCTHIQYYTKVNYNSFQTGQKDAFVCTG